MSFTSWAFVVFLALVWSAYRVLPHRGQNVLLLLASYVFYGWWNVGFLFLLSFSTIVYYSSGLMIHRGSMTRGERAGASLWLIVSAFAFVVVRWDGLSWSLAPLSMRWDPSVASSAAWPVLAGTCGLVLLGNLLHPWIASLDEATRRRVSLWAGIAANLSILGFFKYFNFFAANVQGLLGDLGGPAADLRLDIALPVGISFYTFQGMTYTIDIYRRRLAPTSRLPDLALFMAFFPVVLAGPIERASRLLPQLTGVREVHPGQTSRGLYLILQGLFKKAVLADGVAVTANTVFGAAGPVSWIDAIAGTFFFAIQLYCDFSGYSDMALGIGSLFGIQLTTNFRNPYFSRNVAEFWTRWHVSLSFWFRDYVFVPLGGASGGPLRWVRNVMLTFLLTGLWHGAAWTFVLWGLYHGALLCLQRLKETWKPRAPARNPLTAGLSIAGFFVITCYGWVLFRCRDLQHVVDFTTILVRDAGNLHLTAPLPPETTLVALPLLLVLELVGFLSRGKRLDEVLPVPVWTAFYAAMVFALILGAGAVSSQFVYFTF